MQANNQGFEVIYVSLDRDCASFNEYYGSMPWYTIPYEDEARVSMLDLAIFRWVATSWLLGKIYESFEELQWERTVESFVWKKNKQRWLELIWIRVTIIHVSIVAQGYFDFTLLFILRGPDVRGHFESKLISFKKKSSL